MPAKTAKSVEMLLRKCEILNFLQLAVQADPADHADKDAHSRHDHTKP